MNSLLELSEAIIKSLASAFSSFSRAVVEPSSASRRRPVLATLPSCHTRYCAVCEAPMTSPKCARAPSGGNSRGCVLRDHRLSNVTYTNHISLHMYAQFYRKKFIFS